MSQTAEITILDANPTNIGSHLNRIHELYNKEGVALLRGFLLHDAIYEQFRSELSQVVLQLGRRAGIQIDQDTSLDDQISRLAAKRRDLAGKIYDLGTRPNKLISGMALKLHPALLSIVRFLFPKNALIASPTLSDTLHVFPPGEDSYRYNLPIHQDYPYLLQSPNQVTFAISLSRSCADVGGMTLWRGSHAAGTRKHRRANHGHLECVIDSDTLAAYTEARCDSDVGDVVVFHSNILHRSERNFTADKTRLVQLFRFSDLNDEESKRIAWENADVHPRAKRFEDLYPELIIP